MNGKLLLLLAVCTAVSASCSPSQDPSSQNPDDHHETEEAMESSDRIDIPATVRNNLGITFTPVERRKVDSTIRVPGYFELQPRARHEYRMTLPGHVEFLVDQYQQVEPGDVLYRFASPEWPALQHEIIEGEQIILSAQAHIQVDKARVSEADQNLEILLRRQSALTDADFKQADLESNISEIKASLPRIQAELALSEIVLMNAVRSHEHALHRASVATGIPENDLSRAVEINGKSVPAYQLIDWIEVRAFESGVVESLVVTNGAFVEAFELVVSTVNQKKIRFRATALQADMARLMNSQEARIVPPTIPGIALSDSVPATVTLGLEADPQYRTFSLLAEPLSSKSWFVPGVSAFVEIVVESTGGISLAIPRAAIVQDGIVHVFFRRDPNDPNKAIRVEADMGVSDGRWVAINSGISLDDEIVLHGVYELKLVSQQSGTAQKGGHFHSDGVFHEDK